MLSWTRKRIRTIELTHEITERDLFRDYNFRHQIRHDLIQNLGGRKCILTGHELTSETQQQVASFDHYRSLYKTKITLLILQKKLLLYIPWLWLKLIFPYSIVICPQFCFYDHLSITASWHFSGQSSAFRHLFRIRILFASYTILST